MTKFFTNKIVWLENPNKYEYLRVSKVMCCNPNYKAVNKKYGEKLIGYIKAKYKGNYIYEKFIFWLKEYDRGMPKEKEVYGKEPINYNYMPTEAIKVNEILRGAK